MTPRPNFTHKQRPLSAIYIGSLGSNSSSNTASPPDLPKLPEPPSASPGSSSGLPSPPATNSTGSGSIGDESTSNKGSVRRRPSQRPLSTSDMYNGTKTRIESDMSSASTLKDDDEQNDENDEDNTARFNSSHRLSTPRTTSIENMSALQRVKSLTERNRLVLDKLTSISRHGSPVPGSSSKTAVRSSPFSSNSPSPSLGASSSRLSTPSRLGMSRPRPQSSSKLQTTFPSSSDDRAEPAHSGSETERETTRTYSHTHSYSSSDSLSNTPTSSYAPSDFVRSRRISAPSSPDKSPRKNNRRPSPGPTRTPRKRASMAASVSDVRRDESDDEGEDVTKAALAAVASVRRSPGSMSKRNVTRQALPKEFRESGRRSVLDDRSEPVTPQRDRFFHSPRSPSPSRQPSGSVAETSAPAQSTQRSPRRPSAARYSTVRELTRRHQTRWLSEDLSASSVDVVGENDTPSRPLDASTSAIGRRQGHRTGSSESPYTGRTLLGEGLRATALSNRRDGQKPNGDVIVNGRDPGSSHETPGVFAIPARRTRSTGATSIINGQGEWDSPSPAVVNGRAGTSNGALATSSFSTRTLDPRTPGSMHGASSSYVTPARPSTSMAALHHDAPPASSFRPSSYRSPREHEASSSSTTLDGPTQLTGTPRPDRAYTSLFNYTPRSSHGEGHPEHRKLLLDALGMFESQLSRLPPMGHTTTVTIPEVFQNSQTLVQSLDKLNDMVRNATNRALESQIDVEVGDVDLAHLNLVDLWSTITTEHRDHLRLTEEIVRTMTLFFLGVGRVLRETTMPPGAQQHMRATSLDEDAVRRGTPDANSSATSSDKRSADGRLSRETRRSWEPRGLAETRAVARLASHERSTTSRPSSSTHILAHGSTTSSSEGRSMVESARGKAPTPPTLRSNGSSTMAASSRRFSPHESSSTADPTPATAILMSSLDSQETLRAHEPSPTPLSRHGSLTNHERTRTLPSLSIPPSLPTVPSESIIRRTTSALDRNDRKKSSTSSNITVRAESSLPPVLRPANTTTAVTTATVFNDSPTELSSAMSRTNSSGSAHTHSVIFSRPSSVSVSALNGLQQQHVAKVGRHRSLAASTVEAPSPISVRSPMSGSETERPRTIASRVRTSLDRTAMEDDGSRSRASTLTSTRRTRSRTITSVTEIFARAKNSR